MAAIITFRGGGSDGGRRKNNFSIGGCGTVFKILFSFSIMFLFLGPSPTSAFFIDLDALGFKMSKSDGDIARDDSSLSASDSKLLIATPSPNGDVSGGAQQEIVEIESKTDPHKSVKLTLAELKQLVLGTVKDMTPNPPPINIKITTNKDRPKKGSSSTTTTSTTASPKPKSKKPKKKFNPFKFTDSMLEAYAKSRDPYDGADDDDDFGSHWKRPQSTSFILPPYDDEGIEEHYTKSNEVVDMDGGGGGGEGEGDQGWLKSVFRTPTRVINNYSKSFNRWRGIKPKQKPRHRPIADITYHPRDRQRNSGPPPSRINRRPSGGRRKGGRRPGHRRRGQYERPRNRYSYYDDKYDTSEYSSHRDGGRYSYYGEDNSGDQSWDRMDHLTSKGAAIFDSTMPHDDTPYNMSPPRESY